MFTVDQSFVWRLGLRVRLRAERLVPKEPRLEAAAAKVIIAFPEDPAEVIAFGVWPDDVPLLTGLLSNCRLHIGPKAAEE